MAHIEASLKPAVINVDAMINAMSALPIKHPLNILVNENGSYDLPRYSLEAGFIVTKTAANGLTAEIGTRNSANYKKEFYNFY